MIAMMIRGRLKRWLWGSGRRVRFVFVHPGCGADDVEAAYLPEWGHPKFICRRCGVAFDEARARLHWDARVDPTRG